MSSNQTDQQSTLCSTESSPIDHLPNIPITTQPRAEDTESDLEDVLKEREERQKRKQEMDCCCDPYYEPDECEFYLFCQCFGWFCVQLGKCMESMLEGCADCITTCCEGETSGDAGGCDDVDCCDCNCFD